MTTYKHYVFWVRTRLLSEILKGHYRKNHLRLGRDFLELRNIPESGFPTRAQKNL